MSDSVGSAGGPIWFGSAEAKNPLRYNPNINGAHSCYHACNKLNCKHSIKTITKYFFHLVKYSNFAM